MSTTTKPSWIPSLLMVLARLCFSTKSSQTTCSLRSRITWTMWTSCSQLPSHPTLSCSSKTELLSKAGSRLICRGKKAKTSQVFRPTLSVRLTRALTTTQSQLMTTSTWVTPAHSQTVLKEFRETVKIIRRNLKRTKRSRMWYLGLCLAISLQPAHG